MKNLNRKTDRIPRSAASPKLLCRAGHLLRELQKGFPGASPGTQAAACSCRQESGGFEEQENRLHCNQPLYTVFLLNKYTMCPIYVLNRFSVRKRMSERGERALLVKNLKESEEVCHGSSLS